MVCAEQTIEEQNIKFDFYGDMEGHICRLLIYLTLSNLFYIIKSLRPLTVFKMVAPEAALYLEAKAAKFLDILRLRYI